MAELQDAQALAAQRTAEVQAMRDAAAQAQASKAMLQRSLVEQMAAMRAQLEASSEQNARLEEALLRQQAAQRGEMPPPPPRISAPVS